MTLKYPALFPDYQPQFLCLSSKLPGGGGGGATRHMYKVTRQNLDLSRPLFPIYQRTTSHAAERQEFRKSCFQNLSIQKDVINSQEEPRSGSKIPLRRELQAQRQAQPFCNILQLSYQQRLASACTTPPAGLPTYLSTVTSAADPTPIRNTDF